MRGSIVIQYTTNCYRCRGSISRCNQRFLSLEIADAVGVDPVPRTRQGLFSSKRTLRVCLSQLLPDACCSELMHFLQSAKLLARCGRA